MGDKMLDEKIFRIPSVDFKQVDGKWVWIINGSYSYGKEQIIEKLQAIVSVDRAFWLNSMDMKNNPEIVAKYNALEEFLKSLSD